MTRRGEAFRFEDLAVEAKRFRGVEVRVVTPRQLREMKRGTVRLIDHAGAAALAARCGLVEPGSRRMVATMLALNRLLAPVPTRGARRSRSVEQADADSQGHRVANRPVPAKSRG